MALNKATCNPCIAPPLPVVRKVMKPIRRSTAPCSQNNFQQYQAITSTDTTFYSGTIASWWATFASTARLYSTSLWARRCASAYSASLLPRRKAKEAQNKAFHKGRRICRWLYSRPTLAAGYIFINYKNESSINVACRGSTSSGSVCISSTRNGSRTRCSFSG